MSGTLTPDQVAQDLQIERESVMNRLRQGSIPGYKFGRYWRVDAETYEAWKADLQARPHDPNRIPPRTARAQARIDANRRRTT